MAATDRAIESEPPQHQSAPHAPSTANRLTAAPATGAPQSAGNLAVQSAKTSSSTVASPGAPVAPPVVSLVIRFEPSNPWTFTTNGITDEVLIQAALYGGPMRSPLRPVPMVIFENMTPRIRMGYAIEDPALLRPPYAAAFYEAMRARKAQLDAEVEADGKELEGLLRRYYPVLNTFKIPPLEEKVVNTFRRWAKESFPESPVGPGGERPRSRYLDKLIVKLNDPYRSEGIFVDSWTNYYSMILNHFARADEVRALQNEHSRSFVGDDAIPEAPGFGDILWDDLKEGRVKSRMWNYAVGLKDAGVGVAKGLYTLATDPKKALQAIGELPHTLKTLWQNRSKLWDSFVNASPDEQARMIGRLFGEIEILIATAGAGSGPGTAAKAPELATALEVVEVSGGAAAATWGSGTAITADLGMLGGEAGRLTSLMSITSDVAMEGKQKADDIAAPKAEEPAGGPAKEAPAEAPKEAPKEIAPEPAPKGPIDRKFARGEWDRLSFNEQNAYIKQWMEERGITRIEIINEHHAWPQYLGGPANGPLITLERRLHHLFHTGLDKLLPRKMTVEHYARLSEAEKATNVATLRRYCRDFDIEFRTHTSTILEKALKGTPYE